MAGINFDDLPPELQASLRQDLGIRSKRSITMEEVRRNTIAVLYVIRSLTKRERVRVLKHALKVNEV